MKKMPIFTRKMQKPQTKKAKAKTNRTCKLLQIIKYDNSKNWQGCEEMGPYSLWAI